MQTKSFHQHFFTFGHDFALIVVVCSFHRTNTELITSTNKSNTFPCWQSKLLKVLLTLLHLNDSLIYLKGVWVCLVTLILTKQVSEPSCTILRSHIALLNVPFTTWLVFELAASPVVKASACSPVRLVTNQRFYFFSVSWWNWWWQGKFLTELCLHMAGVWNVTAVLITLLVCFPDEA